MWRTVTFPCGRATAFALNGSASRSIVVCWAGISERRGIAYAGAGRIVFPLQRVMLMSVTNNRVPEELQELLATAAEMRAGGSSWEAIAGKVQRSAETVRRWPR